MDRVTDEQSLSVYSRELKKISAYTTSTVTSPMKLFRRYFIEGWNIIILNATINHWHNNSIGILQQIFFLWAFFVCKIIGIFYWYKCR